MSQTTPSTTKSEKDSISIPSSSYYEEDDAIFFDANIRKKAEELEIIRRAKKEVFVDCSSFDFMDDVEQYIAAGATVSYREGLRRRN